MHSNIWFVFCWKTKMHQKYYLLLIIFSRFPRFLVLSFVNCRTFSPSERSEVIGKRSYVSKAVNTVRYGFPHPPQSELAPDCHERSYFLTDSAGFTSYILYLKSFLSSCHSICSTRPLHLAAKKWQMTYEFHPRRQFAPYMYYVGISRFIATTL